MSKLRHMQLSNCRTIGGATRQVIASAKHVCENELLHVILDFYSEMSLKEGNQLRRSNITPIDQNSSHTLATRHLLGINTEQAGIRPTAIGSRTYEGI